jgi:hypothetical protein
MSVGKEAVIALFFCSDSKPSAQKEGPVADNLL